jgi:hypothetical protein
MAIPPDGAERRLPQPIPLLGATKPRYAIILSKTRAAGEPLEQMELFDFYRQVSFSRSPSFSCVVA